MRYEPAKRSLRPVSAVLAAASISLLRPNRQVQRRYAQEGRLLDEEAGLLDPASIALRRNARAETRANTISAAKGAVGRKPQ